jgi:hypothetical protein
VHRIQKSDIDETERFIQDNFYYLCDVEENAVAQELDGYEAEEAYTLEYVDPATAIAKNRGVSDSPYNPLMFEREARVLELLIAEGILHGGRSRGYDTAPETMNDTYRAQLSEALPAEE